MASSPDTLGQFEAYVLTAVVTLGPRNAYGMAIQEEVEKLTKRSIVSIGAIYTTLDRLEAKGFVSSKIGEKTEERGGRAKKYFFLEGMGQTALLNYLDHVSAINTALAEVWA